MFHLKLRKDTGPCLDDSSKKSIDNENIDNGFLIRIRKTEVEIDGEKRIIVMIQDFSDSIKVDKI